MSELIIIILLIIIIYLYKNDNMIQNKEYNKYVPVSLDRFEEIPNKDEIKKEEVVEPTVAPVEDKKFDDIIDKNFEENDPVYDMFINKLNDNTTENRIFKNKLMYDYRNMDAIEKMVKHNNFHHMKQRFSV